MTTGGRYAMLKYEKPDTPIRVRIWGYINEFTLYAFIGWVYETICESIFAHTLILNRGYLHLPVCPIYGFGAFIALWIMHRFKKLNAFQIFAGGVVITTVVEYIAALIIEAVLHKTLWDYSAWICNFQGRISLISSMIFGLGCLGAYKLRPTMERYCINKKWIRVTALIELAAMAADFIIITFL